MTHAVSPGPSVAYWASKEDLIDISWDDLLLSIEQGTTLTWSYNNLSVV